MFLSSPLFLLSFLGGSLPFTVAAKIDPSKFLSSAIRTSDVVIIGGGSSGTYAAVALKRARHSITLIEKDSRLGGHTDTFKDPATGATFDYGVVALLNRTTVTDYFAFFNEGLTTFQQNNPAVTLNYVDLNGNGQIINPLPASIPWSDPNAVFAGILGYNNEISKYPFLSNGYDLPNPVPPDLLLPFGDFLAKYNLGGVAQIVYSISQGMGNILSLPTLYLFKVLPQTTINAFIGLAPPPITSATFNIQALYDKALAYLSSTATPPAGVGSSAVYLNSNVIAIDRSNPLNRVLVVAHTPSGPRLVIAKKLLIAVQPKLNTLKNELHLPLVPEETNIFKQFNNSYYWNFVLKNNDLPPDQSFGNADPSKAYGIPETPSSYGFRPAPIPQPGGGQINYTLSWYSSPHYMTDAQVKTAMLDTVEKVVTANGLGTRKGEIVGFNNHNPFWLTVPTEAIANGFYGQLNALQGKRNTWWTGATFVAHDSSAIWEWSETTLLPALKASL
ncbi:FAD/NAD(P)-binding domain containing protein [Naviculisporaceae sp. PSN 640]